MRSAECHWAGSTAGQQCGKHGLSSSCRPRSKQIQFQSPYSSVGADDLTPPTHPPGQPSEGLEQMVRPKSHAGSHTQKVLGESQYLMLLTCRSQLKAKPSVPQASPALWGRRCRSGPPWSLLGPRNLVGEPWGDLVPGKASPTLLSFCSAGLSFPF